MEVHHHAHDPAAPHHQKNWKNYFWEFFMLFLAVICGFIAEVQFEHYVEHQREEKYISRIYQDLQRDTAFFVNHIDYLNEQFYQHDSILKMIGNQSYLKAPDQFYALCLKASASKFVETYKSSFEQMKSSGNLRLIRNEKVLDALLKYYDLSDKRAMGVDAAAQELAVKETDAMWAILDAAQFKGGDSIKQNQSLRYYVYTQNAFFPKISGEALLRYQNLCFQRKVLTTHLINFCQQLQQKSTDLIQQIEMTYHVEPE